MTNFLKSIFILLFLFIQMPAFCQQTIINMPSSDVLPKGDVVLKQSNTFRPMKDAYVRLTPQVIIGTGCDSEISLEAAQTIRNGDASTGLNIAAKKVFKFENSARLTFGGVISPNLTDGKKPDSMLFGHTSYEIQKTKTKLTAGGYLGGKQEMPTLLGTMLGVEQSIIPDKLKLAADWISRSESFGMFSVGFKIKPTPTLSVVTAAVVPNAGDNRFAFLFSVSKNIGRKPKEQL